MKTVQTKSRAWFSESGGRPNEQFLRAVSAEQNKVSWSQIINSVNIPLWM